MSDAAQLHKLINLVLSEDRTGILSVRCALNGPVEGLPRDEVLHTFSFLFKTGNLVSARLGFYQDFKVLELVPLIASVAKARWTPMRAHAIAVTDASLSIEVLAELIHHATALPHLRTESTQVVRPASQSQGQKLLQRAHSVFTEVFGQRGEAILLDILKKISPEANPIGFLHRCIDRLAPYLGYTNATNLMVPPNSGEAKSLMSIESTTAS